MTPIGHSITGATIGMLVVPTGRRGWFKACVMLCLVILANVPDIRLPGWGHDRYDISHSVYVSLGLILLLSILFLVSARLRAAVGGGAVVVGGGLAWLSHLLLDTLYNHGLGLAMFWPFSKGRLALPVSWFETLEQPLPHFDRQSARICGIEFLSYGLLFALALFGRRACIRCRRDRRPAPSTDGGYPRNSGQRASSDQP